MKKIYNRRRLRKYKGKQIRIRYKKMRDGKTYYNDSACTLLKVDRNSITIEFDKDILNTILPYDRITSVWIQI